MGSSRLRLCDPLDGGKKLTIIERFSQHFGSTRIKRVVPYFRIIGTGYDDHRQGGLSLRQGIKNLLPTLDRHIKVEQQTPASGRVMGIKKVLAIGKNLDMFILGFQHGLQSITNAIVVIDDKNPRLRRTFHVFSRLMQFCHTQALSHYSQFQEIGKLGEYTYSGTGWNSAPGS